MQLNPIIELIKDLLKEPPSALDHAAPLGVLVADDDEQVRSRISEVLTAAGLEVKTAASGEEALRWLGLRDYDLLIADLEMPGMDGLQLTRQALALRPRTAVVAISGAPAVKNAVEAFKAGALDYVEKPFTPGQLEQFARAALLKKREEQIRAENAFGFLRFTLGERVQHLLLLLSFTLLVLTGIPLIFPTVFQGSFFFAESSLLRGYTHRVSAIILIGAGLAHLVYSLLSPAGNRDLRKILPHPRDLLDLLEQVKFNLGLRAEPARVGKFHLMQKLEYFGVVWGTAIMAATGFMLWFENQTLALFPLWVLDTARIVHRYEAILAALTVFISHIYHVHARPDLFPMSKVWLNGRVSRHDMIEEYPLEYEEQTGCPATHEATLPWPKNHRAEVQS